MLEQQLTPDGDTPYQDEQDDSNQIKEQKLMKPDSEKKMEDEAMVAAFGHPQQLVQNRELDFHLLPQLIEKANASLEFQSPLFIDYLTECLNAINSLGKPISFAKSGSKQGHLMLVGEVGNGKSTTANYLMFNLERRSGKNVDVDFDMDLCFDAGKSSSSVTKEVQ